MGNFINELRGFNSIPRGLVFDNALSDRARFVFVFMACKPDDWQFFLEPMAKEIGYSVDTLRKYIKELVASGWLVKGEQSNDKGSFGAVSYTLRATKFTDTEKYRHGEMPTQHNIDNINIKENTEVNKEKEYKYSSKKDEQTDITQGKKRKKAEFVPPTMDEVAEYIRQKGYHFSAKAFVDFYEADDWHYGNGSGRKKMSNWKRSCTTWENKYMERHGGSDMFAQSEADNRKEIICQRLYEELGDEEADIYGMSRHMWHTFSETQRNYYRKQDTYKAKLLKWIDEHDN